MPIKMQYPVQLHPDTKCPSCNTAIKQIGNLLYVCDTGHVLEAIVLVTMRPKQKQEVKPLVPDAFSQGERIDDAPSEVLNTKPRKAQ